MKKNTVFEKLATINVNDLSNTIDKVIKVFTGLKQEYTEKGSE